jgi:hypothetical protein
MRGGKTEVLRQGSWLYDGTVRCRVVLARRDWDCDYYDHLDEIERPFLNGEGWQYYADFESPATPGLFSSSAACLSLTEAITLAESVASGLRWDE